MALIKNIQTLFLNAIAITATGAAATVTDAGYCWSAFETDEILYHVDTKRYPFDSCESNCPCRFRLCLKLMNHFFYLLVSILFITRKISGSQNNLDYVANRQKIEREREKEKEGEKDSAKWSIRKKLSKIWNEREKRPVTKSTKSFCPTLFAYLRFAAGNNLLFVYHFPASCFF